MPANAGPLVRLQVGGIEYDPVGDFTIRPKRIKREVKETTRQHVYFSETPIVGIITGSVAIRDDQDETRLTDAMDVSVMAETVAGITYQGTMTYTADGDVTTSDGKIQVELSGMLQRLPKHR